MNERTRLKTHSRLSNFYKANHVMETDKGQLLFRIDSPGAVPQDLNSTRSEPETFEWIRGHLNENEVLWDIGANVGVFSLYAALGHKNKVLSIEPSAESYSTLNANIRLNDLEEYIDENFNDAYDLGEVKISGLSKHAFQAMGVIPNESFL